MRSIGSSIAQGLARGISAGVGAVASAARSLAAKAVSAAKSALNINSPSKVFRDEVGSAIPEGVALGVNVNAKDAIQSVTDMTDSLINSVDLKPLRTTVNSTGYSNNMNSSNRGNQMQNTLNAILNALTSKDSALATNSFNVNIEEFNNNTEEDVNSLMQRIEAQIRLNNLGKGVI